MLSDWARGAWFGTIALAFVFGLAWWASEELQTESGCHQQKQSYNQNNNTDSSPSFRHLVPSYYNDPKTADDHDKYYECLVAEYTRKLAIFTRWLVIVTAFLAIVTGGLVVFARRQLVDARVVQRAYVYVRAVHSRFIYDENGAVTDLEVWLTLKNSGATPASTNSTLIGVTFAQPITAFKFGHPTGAVQQPLVFGPDQQIDIGFYSLTIGIDHVRKAAAGVGHQFMWGKIRYRDAFPDSAERIVEFCYKLRLEGRLPPGKGVIHFDPYGEHNRQYDEC